MDALGPNLARADIAFPLAARADGSFDWSYAEAWVREARAAGAEPMLILDYMPPWLAARLPGDPRDPTRLPPRDYTTWERIVREGVRHFALEFGVRWFEVWNEPDWAGFWQETQAEFLELARHTAVAVADVERESGIDLKFGGPACLFPDPGWILPWLALMRSLGIPVDFVSWHFYGNYPFIGPDGPEPGMPPSFHALLGRKNPAGGVLLFGLGADQVRNWTKLSLAGTGWDPELVLDEWNVSAGGFDRRHDTHEGAAFVAAVLSELQRTRVDRAAFFISKDAYASSPEVNPEGREFIGDWGLLSWKGSRKPAWWAFWLWQQLGAEEVKVEGAQPADGLFATASRGPGQELTLTLKPQSLALVELEGGDAPSTGGSLRRRALPATGSSFPKAALPLALLLWASRRKARRSWPDLSSPPGSSGGEHRPGGDGGGFRQQTPP